MIRRTKKSNKKQPICLQRFKERPQSQVRESLKIRNKEKRDIDQLRLVLKQAAAVAVRRVGAKGGR